MPTENDDRHPESIVRAAEILTEQRYGSGRTVPTRFGAATCRNVADIIETQLRSDQLVDSIDKLVKILGDLRLDWIQGHEQSLIDKANFTMAEAHSRVSYYNGTSPMVEEQDVAEDKENNA